MSTRYDPRMFEREERARGAGMIYVLMIVVAVAFGGFVWQLYSGPDVPRIAAQPGPYKMAPTPDMANGPDATEQGAFYNALEGRNAEAPATPRAGPEAVQEQAQPQGPPQLAPAPVFAGNGPFVAQLAALQSEEAAELAWRRMASRAPDLFNRAQLDIERADLGARGIYYRVRAGYFTDRANAVRFCDRIRQMGQDCIVAAR